MVCNTHQQEALEGLRSKKNPEMANKTNLFLTVFCSLPPCGPPLWSWSHENFTRCASRYSESNLFMVKVARTPPSSPKWRGMVIIHQKGGIWADFLAIFSILWLPRAPHMVGSGLSLPKILCQKFWYAILTTRRRWKVPQAKNHKMAKKTPFFDVFFASWPPSRPPIWAYGASLQPLLQNLSHAL